MSRHMMYTAAVPQIQQASTISSDSMTSLVSEAMSTQSSTFVSRTYAHNRTWVVCDWPIGIQSKGVASTLPACQALLVLVCCTMRHPLKHTLM